jgi:hypothetical protein
MFSEPELLLQNAARHAWRILRESDRRNGHEEQTGRRCGGACMYKSFHIDS